VVVFGDAPARRTFEAVGPLLADTAPDVLKAASALAADIAAMPAPAGTVPKLERLART
jgi:hypothetical protein